jgi:UDP-N-acetyl-D-galactosamine dehydrogenase
MHNSRVAVIGLDRFGLSLAARLARSCSVIGFDTDSRRSIVLNADAEALLPTTQLDGVDDKGEPLLQNGKAQKGLLITDDPFMLADVNLYVIVVPDANCVSGVLDRLLKATECVGMALDHGDTVIFEPGFMQQASFHTCLSLLEEHSGLSCWADFTIGFIDRFSHDMAEGRGELAKRCGIVAAAAVYRRYRSKLFTNRRKEMLHVKTGFR